jgi:hypothetical protein
MSNVLECFMSGSSGNHSSRLSPEGMLYVVMLTMHHPK